MNTFKKLVESLVHKSLTKSTKNNHEHWNDSGWKGAYTQVKNHILDDVDPLAENSWYHHATLDKPETYAKGDNAKSIHSYDSRKHSGSIHKDNFRSEDGAEKSSHDKLTLPAGTKVVRVVIDGKKSTYSHHPEHGYIHIKH